MKEKITIKNGVFEDETLMILSNTIKIKDGDDIIEINNEDEITEELRDNYKYITIYKAIKFINTETYKRDIKYVFKIVLDIDTYIMIQGYTLVDIINDDSQAQISKDGIINDDDNINIIIKDPYHLFDLEDSLVFEFDNGLQIMYTMEEFLDDVFEIQNKDMIKDEAFQISVSNEMSIENERILTKEELRSDNLDDLIELYKYITIEKRMLTTNNILYVFGTKYSQPDNIVALYAYCVDLETDNFTDIMDTEYFDRMRGENKTSIYIRDPYNILLPEDRIETCVSDNVMSKFIVINNNEQVEDIEEENDLKNFLSTYFK